MTETVRKRFDIKNQPKTTYEAVRQDLSGESTESLVATLISCEQGITRGLREGVRMFGVDYGPVTDDTLTLMRNVRRTLVNRGKANIEGS